MAKRYWIVKGETRRKILAHLKSVDDAIGQIEAWAKVQGGTAAYCRGGLGTTVVLKFKTPPTNGLWKTLRKKPEFWEPRLATKKGKALRETLEELEQAVPDGMDIAKIISMEAFVDDRWRTPGAGWLGRDVVIVTPDDYTPSKGLADDIRRISDVDYERRMAKKKAARAAG